VIAARQYDVDQRVATLDLCGLNVVGLQPDSVALANFAAFEFAEPWDQDADETSAVMLVDFGASTTKVVIVSGETQWFWSVETGGEDLTTALSRPTKSTHADAERMKRDPASIPAPATMYEPLEARLDELRARLQRVVADAKQQNSRFRIDACWCMGGAAMTHGLIRRTLLASASPPTMR
jgi:Tfp pilus assembly PilM family ATPase